MTITILDCKGKEITVGAMLIYGEPPLGETDDYMVEVISISDPDADYDDELGRGVEYPPEVTVRFPDGQEERVKTYNTTQISWACYPDGPEDLEYTCDDLEVLA